jgi:hypothetical protein
MGVYKAVHAGLLSKPWLYRVVSDRGYGNIFVVEKLGGETSIGEWADRLNSVAPYPTARAEETSPAEPPPEPIPSSAARDARRSPLARLLGGLRARRPSPL